MGGGDIGLLLLLPPAPAPVVQVIACYTLLQLRHKAAEIIQSRLAERETPRLWCLLGDANDDLQCYHKALELSQDRSARALRSIGFHYYSRKEYTTCISWFERSLERSSMQPITLLRVSYAAMELEDWERAARAYRAYCAIEQVDRCSRSCYYSCSYSCSY